MTGTAFGLLIPLLGTVLGSAFVFFMKNEMPARLQKALLGFASGVMVAASIWSLIIPSMEMWEDQGRLRIIPALVGFLAGIAFLLLIDYITPHLHMGSSKPEGPRTKLSRTAMLTFAVTIHNLPEGMAVGVVLAGAMQASTSISTAGAMAMALGIAIQNIPEGAIISMPMKEAGNSRLKSFIIGALSGVVEPIGAILVILAQFCRWCNVLCSSRRTYSRSFRGRAFQSFYHWICHWICRYDDLGCCLRIKK